MVPWLGKGLMTMQVHMVLIAGDAIFQLVALQFATEILNPHPVLFRKLPRFAT